MTQKDCRTAACYLRRWTVKKARPGIGPRRTPSPAYPRFGTPNCVPKASRYSIVIQKPANSLDRDKDNFARCATRMNLVTRVQSATRPTAVLPATVPMEKHVQKHSTEAMCWGHVASRAKMQMTCVGFLPGYTRTSMRPWKTLNSAKSPYRTW